MPEWFIDPVFIVFAFLTVTSVVGTLAHMWRKVRQTQIEADLKRELLQNGMSADDIKKVIEAGQCKRGKEADVEKH